MNFKIKSLILRQFYFDNLYSFQIKINGIYKKIFFLLSIDAQDESTIVPIANAQEESTVVSIPDSTHDPSFTESDGECTKIL